MNLRFYVVFHGVVSHLLSISFHANSQAVYLVWCFCNNLKTLPTLTGVFHRLMLLILRLCHIPWNNSQRAAVGSGALL